MSETSVQEECATPVPAAPRARRGLLFPGLMIWLGITLIAGAAILEDFWLAGVPWSACIVVPDMPLKAHPGLQTLEGIEPVLARNVKAPPAAAQNNPLRAAANVLSGIEGLGMSMSFVPQERIVAADIAPAELESLLISGRAPTPGAPEILAGDLCELDTCSLDGVPFHVVGHLRPEISGFIHAYLLPYSESMKVYFTTTNGATEGWMHRDGIKHIDEFKEAVESTGRAAWPPREIHGIQARTAPIFFWMVLIALVIVAAGGALLHTRIFASWSEPPTLILGPLLSETVAWPRLFAGMHLILYGLFFAAMIAGGFLPDVNYAMTRYVSEIFREGGLSYIGAAYASGSILDAAVTTFHNNYWVQTLQYTFATSFALLPVGFLKTALSFAMAGFVMSPLWTGTANGYVFHSITMILELEAYIVASFAVVIWPARFLLAFRDALGFRRDDPNAPIPYHHLTIGIRAFAGAIILTGAMLAIAALYEAVSLILLGS